MKHFLSIAVLGLLSAFIHTSAVQAQQFGSRETLVIVEPVQWMQGDRKWRLSKRKLT